MFPLVSVEGRVSNVLMYTAALVACTDCAEKHSSCPILSLFHPAGTNFGRAGAYSSVVPALPRGVCVLMTAPSSATIPSIRKASDNSVAATIGTPIAICDRSIAQHMSHANIRFILWSSC